ncbi:Uncharacterised protein [Vibrio cholerae]|uniref:Uncharacterized protein n=1 Tax=Vibrio cholerae TaxID=666 RepID=A0A655PPR7_VIBCL|nr:Uncharacterised protein [Vibrio cholerae]CSA22957.1 Uncharacterised protein [Vibrio cholerae]
MNRFFFFTRFWIGKTCFIKGVFRFRHNTRDTGITSDIHCSADHIQ